MNQSDIKKSDSKIYQLIKLEEKRQSEGIELIPSENYVSSAVLEALGSVFTNKYSEGYSGNRYYGGQVNVDQVENLAIERAKKLFGAEHVNVQPLSGAPANIAVYSALMQLGETILGMDLSHGGHLTHGHPVTFMAKIYNFIRYKTLPSGEIDYDQVEEIAMKNKPKIILCGYSAYTREIDYKKFKNIADKIGAITMADIAHIAGLIAAGQMNNPVPIFDVVTTTTHKTLRGPRGGMIMCKEKYAKIIDKAVFPGLQGGPHENNIAAKAVAFGEDLEPSFITYAKQIIKNAKAMEKTFKKFGYTICFGQTDNHMLLIDLTNKNITGKEAQNLLDSVGITLNKNMVPDDPRSPMDPSGIRLGTPAATTRGMKERELIQIATWINKVIVNRNNSQVLAKIKKDVKNLCKKFPVPGI